MPHALDDLLELTPQTANIRTKAPGPQGTLPLTDDILRNWSSGDLFGMTQGAGMGWTPAQLNRKQFLILSTTGGLRDDQGNPVALGYHTGHWELGLLVREAAVQFKDMKTLPFAAYCSDPCDGRTQGTAGMMDSLPYRNDAAIVLRRLIRSLPQRKGVMGVATCDKGLPAMMMALAGCAHLPGILVPGGVTLPPEQGEDTARVQTIGARYSAGELSLEEAANAGCRACGSPGGGCQFLGTAATSQVVGEALGLSLPHSALTPSGQAVWLNMARQSATALVLAERKGLTLKDALTDKAIENAMVVHAAFGGSTNLLLHIPAIAHAAKLRRPDAKQWIELNRRTPRLVDVLPNGPVGHVTVRAWLAGGVPEVMCHLRDLGLLHTDCLTCTGHALNEVLDWWQQSERRESMRQQLLEKDHINPDDVIMPPQAAARCGLTSTVTFPVGNLAPEGSVIKSTAIDPSVVDDEGVYRHCGPARVFTREPAAIEAIKQGVIQKGDVMVLVCLGPLGSGMPETYQITAALKYLPFGKEVALITDGRFSGVSTGACIGHVGPEALAGGPIGKVKEGDMIEIVIDRKTLIGSVNLVGADHKAVDASHGDHLLATRSLRDDLSADPALPDDTRLWAALQSHSGGIWGGCVYDVDAITAP